MPTRLLTSAVALFVAINISTPLVAGKPGNNEEQEQKNKGKPVKKVAFKLLGIGQADNDGTSASSNSGGADIVSEQEDSGNRQTEEPDQDAVIAEVLESIAAVDSALERHEQMQQLLDEQDDDNDSLFDGSHSKKKASRKEKKERQQKQSSENAAALDELRQTLDRMDEPDKPLDEDLLSTLLVEPEGEEQSIGSTDSKAQAVALPPRRGRSHTEEALALDMSQFVQPKTWWETLISISPERKGELEALQEEEKLLAAQLSLEQGKVKIANGPGSKEIEEILLDEAVKKTAMDQLKKRRKLARKLVEDAQVRNFISAHKARQVRRRIDAAEAATNQKQAFAPHPLSWWWRLLGYTDEDIPNPPNNLEAHNEKENQADSANEAQNHLTTEQWLFDLLDIDQASEDLTASRVDVLKPDPTPEDFDYEYTEAEHVAYTNNVTEFLNNKTPLDQWDTATAIWFARHGANRKFMLQPIEDPLSKASTRKSKPKTRRGRASSAILITSTQEFTAQEVEDLFREQIKKHEKQKTFILDWAPHVWKYLEINHSNGEPPLMERLDFLDLEKDMQMARKVQGLLQANIPGHRWDQDIWKWFETYGHTQTYGNINAADYYHSLKANRTIPYNLEKYLQDQVPPNRWEQGTWNWFKEHALNRVIAGIPIDPSLHAAIQEQRKTGQCLDPKAAGDNAQKFSKALHFAPTYTAREDQEFTKNVEDTLLSEYGIEINQWRLEDILSWKLKFTKWLLYDQEDRIFNAPGPGGRKPRPLPFHKLFESFAAAYLQEALAVYAPLDMNALQVNWSDWDPHTAYWFEHFARDREFQIEDTKVVITPEIHRAFLRELDYFEIAINLLSDNASIADIPLDAWMWFQEAVGAGKIFSKRMAGTVFTYKTDHTTIPQLYTKAMVKYLVNEAAGNQWRDDIWQWMQKEWALKAKADGDDDADNKFLIYHVAGHNSSRKLTKEVYSKLVSDRSDN